MFVSIFIQSTVFIAVVVLIGGGIGWLTRARRGASDASEGS